MARLHRSLLSAPASTVLLVFVVAGCAAEADDASGPRSCAASGARFATHVARHEFGPGQDFGQEAFPERVLGPPSGAGCCAGSLHVTSLGDGGSVELEFEGTLIVDGPGTDFIVFENPFAPAGASPDDVYAELGTVSVSEDGASWHAFDCSRSSYPYGDCAGWRPVLANPATNDIDPLDPERAGGDPFDLAILGVSRARYVRIDDRVDLEPGTGTGTFDLDAVGVVHSDCR